MTPINNITQDDCLFCLSPPQDSVICADESFTLIYNNNDVILEKKVLLSCLKAHIYCRKCIERWENENIKKCIYCRRPYAKYFFFDLNYKEEQETKFKTGLIFQKHLIDLTKNDFTKEGFSKLTTEKKIRVINILQKTKNNKLIDQIANDEDKNFYAKNVLNFWKKLPYGPDYIETEIHEFSDFEKTFFLKDWINNNPFIKNLNYLDLSNSNLDFLPDEINLFNNLIRLYAQDNQLEFLSENFTENFSKLEELCLHNNHLKELPKNFVQNSKKLKFLCLRKNYLKSLPDDITDNLQYLETLSFSENKIESLPENFAKNLPRLQEIYLQGNQLKELPKNFVQNSKNLKKINLSKNYLENLPKNFSENLFSLEELYLNENNLVASFPENFNLSKLKTLALQNNNLSNLPKNFIANLNALQTLDLGENPLQKLPENLDKFKQKEGASLYLDDKLKTLFWKTFPHIPKT